MASNTKKAPAVREHQSRGADQDPQQKEPIMNFSRNATSTQRKRKAQDQAGAICLTVKARAKANGIGPWRLATKTKVPVRRVLVMWLGFDLTMTELAQYMSVLQLTTSDTFAHTRAVR